MRQLASSKRLPVAFAFVSMLMLRVPLALASGPVHFSTLPLQDPPPSARQCAAMIPQAPEVRPNNAPFNQTVPSSSELLEFYHHPVWSGPPARDFYGVTGNYRGSTDMILRWAACKWGIDEDVVRAQAWNESKWRQGGPNPGDGGETNGSPNKSVSRVISEPCGILVARTAATSRGEYSRPKFITRGVLGP